MVDYKLSFLIPARNEQFLAQTVQDLLENTSADSEIIIGLDGAWADPVIVDHPRVKIFHVSESIGQRAMTNQLARLSKAKYVCKVDAHCAFEKDWDLKMFKVFEEVGDNVTMVSTMRNLHAFNWVCPDKHIRYQSPSGPCKDCGKPTERDVVWIPKTRPESTSYCFDAEPHFQYFREYTKREPYLTDVKTGLTETMSLQGSCFMMTREKYWELNICDEELFGSWGSQGIEVACKTWLSGGRVMVNHNTWYAHMFRTQGGDFGFPYPQQESKIQEAKKKAKELFFAGEFPQQVKPLSWLVEKFWPIKGWTDEDLAKLKNVIISNN